MNSRGSWVLAVTGSKSNSPAHLSDSVVMKWLCGVLNPHGWLPLDFWIKCCQLYAKYHIFRTVLGPKTLFRPITHYFGWCAGCWRSLKPRTACVHITEVWYPLTTGGSPHKHTQTHAYQRRRPALCPCACLLLGDKAGFYVRKRLMPEPGELSEPQRLRSAVYMLKLLKDVKQYPLFWLSDSATLTQTQSKRCMDVEAFGTAADICCCAPQPMNTSSRVHERPWPFLHSDRRRD